MNILIITSSFDKTIDFLINKFKHKYQFLRLNLDQIDQYCLALTKEGLVFRSQEDATQDLFNEIKSIYFRKIYLPDLSKYDSLYHNYMQKEIYNFIIGIADSFEGRVLSKPSLLRQVENKIYQFHLAKKLNLLIPDVCISNCAAYVNSNVALGEWIAKPISIGKITNDKQILTNVLEHYVHNIELSPTYFQKKIKNDYELRITYINGFFYCVKIVSQKVDWRNDVNAKYELIDVPEIVKEECLRFLYYTGLNFGAFDYIVNNGNYYFLECNPNGQWLWLENKLNLDISEKIMEFLNND